MTREELLELEGCSVRLEYRTKIGPQKRTGYLRAVTLYKAIFWPMNVDIDTEVILNFDDIDGVELI